ncbi:MAG: hypothetical protein JWO83_1176 [Caulobacteraceae bacterium]|jgi:hypothetical protein|nr:hypothetical protein [Caulobacteraceae bacterium]
MTILHPARVWLRVLSLATVAALAGCSVPPRSALPTDALDHAVADAIGDPDTCLLLADRASGKVLYRYGAPFNCIRGLPACDRQGFLSANQALALAATPGGRRASCPSNTDGSRTVGWAEGKVASHQRDLVYSAMMEGQTALPGQEMNARLYDAFQKVGL